MDNVSEQDQKKIDLIEDLKSLRNALSMIEQIKGGRISRSSYEEVQDIVKALIYGMVFLNRTPSPGLTLYRGRIISDGQLLKNKSDFSYCPEEKITEFGRCNSPDNTVFYGSNNLDTVLSELKPEIGDIVQVGVAQLKQGSSFEIAVLGEVDHIRRYERSLLGQPNMYVEKIFKDFLPNEQSKIYLIDAFCAEMFSLPNNNQKDYFFTCALSNLIFDLPAKEKKGAVDGFVYPSVAHRGGINLAIKPKSFDSHFDFSGFMSFKIHDYLGFGLYGRVQEHIGIYNNKEGVIDWKALDIPKEMIPERISI
ncbi:RES domain-containing protein [Colwellia sp. 1_MG-2023]|uniref:RES domain-containing protein n=1 Tax=Colwellia sp. 1_MG-2023 TaxID=3062649 RepID=UPI0026E2AC96|nr:RES domain-containing protein [Colwellia sp. 1_MG-2023]MDO6445177.1 RES domain-containing protein [Colwellia sp. 1_MG-2023]